MPKIILETKIYASIEVCFDLSLSVDLHQISTVKTGEHIVAGVKNGTMKLGETVTWRAKHFGIWQELTSKITEENRPNYFCDEMQKGTFKSLRHKHHFTQKTDHALMLDIFEFEAPFGIFGEIFNKLMLTNYLKKFLIERDLVIKKYAERLLNA